MKLRIPIIVLTIGIILTVLLYFVPHQPTIDKISEAEQPEENVETSIEKALELIKSGGKPMEGILMLREIAEKDPTNIEALYQLGFFSIQSGQLDKAIGRFKQIENLDSTRSDVVYYLAGIFEQKLDTVNALSYYKKFKSLSNDEALKKQVLEKIDLLTIKN